MFVNLHRDDIIIDRTIYNTLNEWLYYPIIYFIFSNNKHIIDILEQSSILHLYTSYSILETSFTKQVKTPFYIVFTIYPTIDGILYNSIPLILQYSMFTNTFLDTPDTVMQQLNYIKQVTPTGLDITLDTDTINTVKSNYSNFQNKLNALCRELSNRTAEYLDTVNAVLKVAKNYGIKSELSTKELKEIISNIKKKYPNYTVSQILHELIYYKK